MTAVVEIEDAALSYRRGAPALTGVTFTARAGSAIAVIGPNGAGKSTLFAGLVNTVPHVARRWEVPAPRNIGLVPQSFAADPIFPVTLEDVVLMDRTARLGIRRPRRHDRRIARGAIEQVGLDHQRRKQFGALSGGQRQRGLLARAIAAEPRLMLLDEPLNGLDQESRASLLDVIERLKAQGVALIISTHEPKLARALCEKSLLINRTQIAFGDTASVFAHPEAQHVFQDAG